MIDAPLPPPRPDMNLATRDMFKAETSDSYKPGSNVSGMEIRDLELSGVSGGVLAGQIFRVSMPRVPLPGTWHMHDLAFHIGYITKGWGLYEFEGIGRIRVEAGTSIFHPPRNRLRMLDCSDDFEGIWLKSSSRDKVTAFVYDENAEVFNEQTFVRELG